MDCNSIGDCAQSRSENMTTMSTQKFPKVTHVIFDLDGTLIDSEKYFYNSITDILEEYGKSMDWELRNKTIGLFLTKSAPIIIDSLKLPCTADDYVERVLARFKQYVVGEVDGVGVQFLPGVKKLVSHLHKHNIPMAICTGSMKETFNFKIERFKDTNFFDLFHHVVIAAADPEIEKTQNKPNCKPYLVCMKRFADMPSSPNHVLAFEDSPTGLASAVASGCTTVMVQSNPNLIDCSQFKIKPDLFLPTLEHFDPRNFGLPAYADSENT